MHHACWKVWMFCRQVKLTVKEEDGLKEICLFSVLIYLKAWMTASVITGAPKNDFHLMNLLISYRIFNAAISRTTSEKLLNHLWYLSEELAPIAFFDLNVSVTMKRLMIKALEEDGRFHQATASSTRLGNVPQQRIGIVYIKKFDGLLSAAGV